MDSVFEIGRIHLGLALLVDWLIGDPRRLPHPVRMIGRFIKWMEDLLRRFTWGALSERIAGGILAVTVVSLSFSLTAGGLFLLTQLKGPFQFLFHIIFVWLVSTTVATKELLSSAGQVIEHLVEGDIQGARASLSMIVGRDTKSLSEEEILRATVESLSENLSDGVVAPLFYLLVGGLPAAMAYKAINTLDSMVGYKHPRYRYLGWASARLDDLANFLPARLTGLLITLTQVLNPSAFMRTLGVMLRDGGRHPSPNSGVPEAAIAGALGVQLGGPSTYRGVVMEKPRIGTPLRRLDISTAQKAIVIIKVAAVTGYILILMVI